MDPVGIAPAPTPTGPTSPDDPPEVQALFQAITANEPKRVEALLVRSGPNVASLYKKRTPLHYASECGNSNIVKLLLLKGARVEALDIYRATPLHQVSS